MDGRQRITGRQASRSHTAWTWALTVILVVSGSLVPSREIAASVPGFPRGSVSAAGEIAAPIAEDEGPDAVEPQPLAGERVIGRTAYTRTERNTDGSYTTTLSARPIHFHDKATGAWKPYVNDLRPATIPGYSHENAAGGYKVSFDQPVDVAAGRPVMRLATDDASITAVALGAKPSSSAVGGPRIKYVDAYPGVDLEYVVNNERVKEDITIKRAPANAASGTFSYELRLEGLTATKRADNSIEFRDASGKVAFVMPRPFMVDSGDEPEKAYSDDVQVTLTELAAGKLRLELAPDLAWLQDQARVYPVTLDPTVEQVVYTPNGSVGKDTTIYEVDPNRNDAAYNVLQVGRNTTVDATHPGGYRRDTLIQFPELDALPQDSVVTTAYLKMYAGSGTNALPMEIHANTADWNEADVTWNTRPSMGDAIYGSPTSTVPGWNSMRISGLVRYWVKRTLTNRGVRIFTTSTTAGQSVPFDASDSLDPNKWPQLQVNYVPATRYGHDDLQSYTFHDHGGGNSSQDNVSTGNLVFEHTGGNAFATGGSAVDLTHTYNSQDPYGQSDLYEKPGAFYGEGWTFSQNLRLYEAGDGSVAYKDGTGANHVFAQNATSGAQRIYYSPVNYGYTLTKDVAATPADPLKVYKLSADSGEEILYFDGAGKVTRAEDLLGGTYLIYGYDAQGRLVHIADEATRQVTLEYLGPGSPGRLSKIVDMSERTHTYEYDTAGNLKTIKHGVGTSEVRTTTFGYGVANRLTSVTNPSGQTSYIEYEVENRWDGSTVANPAEGYQPEFRATGVAQDATKSFRGGGSLRVDMSNLTSSTLAIAARVPASPESWNAMQQELVAFVWTPSGSQLQARLMLRDERGRQVYGPWWPATAGAWTQVAMPAAHVDPGYKVTKVSVQLSVSPDAPTTASTFTGSVWVDHLLVRGTVSYYSPLGTVGQFRYIWGDRETEVTGPDEGGTTRTTTHTYDRWGKVTGIDTNPRPGCN